jgi:hypothetical protein
MRMLVSVLSMNPIESFEVVVIFCVYATTLSIFSASNPVYERMWANKGICKRKIKLKTMMMRQKSHLGIVS